MIPDFQLEVHGLALTGGAFLVSGTPGIGGGHFILPVQECSPVVEKQLFSGLAWRRITAPNYRTFSPLSPIDVTGMTCNELRI